MKTISIICLLIISYMPFCIADNNFDFLYEKYNIDKSLELFSIEKESDLFWGEFLLIRILRKNILPFSFDFFIYKNDTGKVMPIYSEFSLLFKPALFNIQDYNDFVIPLELLIKNKDEYLMYLERIEKLFRNILILDTESIISSYKINYYILSTVNDNLHSFYEEQINRLSKKDYTVYFNQIEPDRAKIIYYSYNILQIHVLTKVTIILKNNGEIVELKRERDYKSEIYPDKTDAFDFLIK